MGQFGDRLRAARLKARLSQDDLAGITGIAKPRLSRYENGHVQPRLDTVEALAGALRVKPAALVGWDR